MSRVVWFLQCLFHHKNLLCYSERANLIDYDKDRLKEGANINKSLVTLGNVIKALGEHSRSNNYFISLEEYT